MMNPSEPTIATPAKLILTIKESSSREGFVVTMRRRLDESMNSRKFKVEILLLHVTELLLSLFVEIETLLF
jgi:hypothetical protein